MSNQEDSSRMTESVSKLVQEIKLQIEYHRFEIDDLYSQWRIIEDKEATRRMKIRNKLMAQIRAPGGATAGRMQVSLLPNDEPD